VGGHQDRPERVWKISPPSGFDPWTFQPVASSYIDYANPVHQPRMIMPKVYWSVRVNTALQAGRSRVRFPMVSLEFFIDIILLAALWSRSLDAASNRNKYQKHLLVGKGGRCVELTLPTSCADFLEIWEPQPPASLWARNRPEHGLFYLAFACNSEEFLNWKIGGR
jgi:hypothetical protein